jgi:hypothetical protein
VRLRFIQPTISLTIVLLLTTPASLPAQPIQDVGDEDPAAERAQKKASKKEAQKRKEETTPAVGGRVLSECSATEATERLASALGGLRSMKNLRVVPGRSVHVGYRGRDVTLEVTAHGSCQASFLASLPYLGRPGEEAAIRRAYNAVMEPAVATLAECDPQACLEQVAKTDEARREAAARSEATAVSEATQEQARRAGETPESAEQIARSAGALTYLKALSSDEAYTQAIDIVRKALPTPLTAQFPKAGTSDTSVILLESTPKDRSGGAKLAALRESISDNSLPEELRTRFRAVLSEVEAQVAGPCYQVTGYVDFQNRCGALVRGRYEAYVSRREGSDWFAVSAPSIDFPDCPGR